MSSHGSNPYLPLANRQPGLDQYPASAKNLIDALKKIQFCTALDVLDIDNSILYLMGFFPPNLPYD